MPAAIDRFLATGDAAKKKKTKTSATISRVGLLCTNCDGSHNTRDCPYEKKRGGLHNEDGTTIRVCSICHKPGHTKSTCPELANFGTHNWHQCGVPGFVEARPEPVGRTTSNSNSCRFRTSPCMLASEQLNVAPSLIERLSFRPFVCPYSTSAGNPDSAPCRRRLA